MVKHTQTIRRPHPTNFLSVFDYFVGLALKRLKLNAIATNQSIDKIGKVMETLP